MSIACSVEAGLSLLALRCWKTRGERLAQLVVSRHEHCDTPAWALSFDVREGSTQAHDVDLEAAGDAELPLVRLADELIARVRIWAMR